MFLSFKNIVFNPILGSKIQQGTDSHDAHSPKTYILPEEDEIRYQWGGSSGGGLVAKLCPTLATPWTVARQAPLSRGFSRHGYWGGLPFPSPGGSSQPRDRTWIS